MFLSTLMSSHVDMYLPTPALAWYWELWSKKDASCLGELAGSQGGLFSNKVPRFRSGSV